jgi:stage II sporulation SpoE-like protein
MANVVRCEVDGYSTAGTAGTGLGAMRRMASLFEVSSQPGRGTVVLARVGPRRGAIADSADIVAEGLAVAKTGETACGDAWAEEPRSGGTALIVVDGLGHGLGAAQAAREAVATFHALRGKPPIIRLEAIHAALRSTRGAAVAVVDIDVIEGLASFVGLGNISASIHHQGTTRHLISHNGTAGHVASRIRDAQYPWPDDAVLIVHSDGVATIRDTEAYVPLLRRDPSLLAGVLYRDLARGHDDATVVVARRSGA